MLDFGYYHMNCMDGMRQFPDQFFDLAIVDPPYAITGGFSPQSRVAKYGDCSAANDEKPTPEYFAELFRVSKNQIIWGYNHLSDMLPSTKEFIFWFKHNPVTSYSDGELAWTSFDKTARCFDYPYFGTVGADPDRIHPTQKPVALYIWILQQYAKRGDKLLDTHTGSASSLIAFEQRGFDYVAFEKAKKFYDDSQKRLQQRRAQQSLFTTEQISLV